MLNKKRNYSALLFLFIFPVSVFAAENNSQPVKTYILTDLRKMIGNGPQCDAFNKDLEGLTKNSFVMQFTKQEEGKHSVNDLSGQISNHTHTTVKQSVKNNFVQRVGIGTFELNSKKIDYVLSVSADLDNEKHEYLYPMILSTADARCSCSALLKPDAATVEAFKKSIQSGAVAKGTDLHQK